MIRNICGTVLALASMLLATVSRTDARSCSSFNLRPDQLQDGQIFYLSTTNGWQPFSNLQIITASRPHSITFAYVVKDQPNPGRKGVIVIKSGHPADSTSQNGNANTVHLVRNEIAAGFTNACAMKRHGNQPNAQFPLQGVRIPSKSYDDFHDYTGRQPPELSTLQAFHVAYEGPRAECRETDDTATDDLNPNNRSQFSFSPERVRSGQVVGLATFWSRAMASEGLADERTELRRYETSADGTACITFQIPILGTNYFLRVNDLDVRIGFGVRRPEGSW